MAKKKELSVWQFVAGKTSEREDYKYICMDDRNRVAVGTNGKMLFVNPDEYVEVPYNYLNKVLTRCKKS